MPKTTHTTNATTTETTAAEKRPPPRRGIDEEGESQSRFIHPGEGGSYVRNADGSLTREQRPTKVPEWSPITSGPVEDNDNDKRAPRAPKE